MDELIYVCEMIDSVIDTNGSYEIYTIDEQMSSLSMSTYRIDYTDEEINMIMNTIGIYQYDPMEIYHNVSDNITIVHDMDAIIVFINK